MLRQERWVWCTRVARLHSHLLQPPSQSTSPLAVSATVSAPPYKLEKLHPRFGARLKNVDIADIENMTQDQWDFIQATFDEYGVVVMGGQGDDLPPKALSELACKFHRSDPVEIGLPAEVGPHYGKKPRKKKFSGGGWGGVPKHPEIGILGINAGAFGLQDSTSIGIEWHIDSAPGGGPVKKKLTDGTEVRSRVTAGCATVIYSVLAPEQGGETLFAHGGVCYDLLDPETQRRAEAAVVRYPGSFGKLEDAVMGNGGTKIVDDDKITNRMPLVRTNPVNGRKCIWVTPRFMESIEGMSVEESRDFVSSTIQPGTSPEHVYVHKYEVGDVVVWDDRHCFHSTSPVKEREERYGTGGVVGRRIIHRVASAVAAAFKYGEEESDESSEEEDDEEEKEEVKEEQEEEPVVDNHKPSDDGQEGEDGSINIVGTRRRERVSRIK